MSLEFMLVQPTTGKILCELPDAVLKSSINAGIGWAEDISVDVPLVPGLASHFFTSVDAGHSMLVVNDSRTNIPLWAGVVKKHSFGSGPVFSIAAESIENWLNRSVVPHGEVRLELADLVEHLGLGLVTQHMHGEVVKESTGVWVTRSYEASKATKRLDAIHDLMRSERIEFCIFYRWDSESCLVPRAVIKERIGRTTADNQAPMFVLGEGEWSVTVDYSDGKGAAVVHTYGNHDGADNAQERIEYTARADDLLAQGWLPTEYSFQPESGSTTVGVLKAAAERKRDEIALGTTTVTCKALLEHIRVGVDVDRGDEFVADLVNPSAPSLNRTIQARMVGWSLETTGNSITHISPILLDASPLN